MPATATHPVLIGGQWRPAHATQTFAATNPKSREPLPDVYPISEWPDIDAALTAAAAAATALRALPDVGERTATFLERYAAGIEAAGETLAATAAAETGLAVAPRLQAVELPRTTGQLRQAAAAARDGTWLNPTIDTKLGLRSCLAPVGPVWVIGPNNFPFAFNGISGGDFAAAIAAGNPVVAKGHPLHPTTSRLLAEIAHAAAVDLPPGTVQMLYHMTPANGLRLVGDSRLKAVAFTGSRAGGLKLKAAADAAGKLFFGEMSSVNPVVILPGALAEDGEGIATQLAGSVTMGTGQFCTKPGVVVLTAGPTTEVFVEKVQTKLFAAPAGVLFSVAGQSAMLASLNTLRKAGADVLLGGSPNDATSVQNTLLRASAERFLAAPHALQTEAFGNAVLLVVADDDAQRLAVLDRLEGNLTGTVYSAKDGSDDAAYNAVVAALRPKVGRLLNDKMPTGVAVSAAMNHGGPYPATSQPHFTAVGLPGSIGRFTQLESYDNVRSHRLPTCLADQNPTGRMWRLVDGNWSQADV